MNDDDLLELELGMTPNLENKSSSILGFQPKNAVSFIKKGSAAEKKYKSALSQINENQYDYEDYKFYICKVVEQAEEDG